jgi:hypothetical protein
MQTHQPTDLQFQKTDNFPPSMQGSETPWGTTPRVAPRSMRQTSRKSLKPPTDLNSPSSSPASSDDPAAPSSNYNSSPILSSSDDCVKVIVRIRPPNNREKCSSISSSLNCVETSGPCTVILSDPGRTDPVVRSYDAVLSPDAQQADVFAAAGQDVVENCMAGFNSSLFAYGQTGAGKTYTMLGDVERQSDSDGSLAPAAGLIIRVFDELFRRIEDAEQAHADGGLRFSVKCSFLECYNEEISDLLAVPPSSNSGTTAAALNPSSSSTTITSSSSTGGGMSVRDGDATKGVYIQGLSEVNVLNADDVLALIQRGAAQQRQAATKMNDRSSRSHSVFTATIEAREHRADTGLTSVQCSKLNLIDLAGSERVGKSGATGEQLTEARSINKSLTCLGRVIQALVERQKNPRVHIPYRDSRLTFLLQESLGGNSKTWFVACVTPAVDSAQETFSTLVFAAGAKKIKNKAVVNVDTVGDMRALQAENTRLMRSVADLQSRIRYEAEGQSTVKELKQKLERTEELFDQNCTAINELRAEHAVTKRELRDAKEMVMKLEEENNQLKSDNRGLGSEAARLQEDYDRLRGELEKGQDSARRAEAERRDLALERDRLESEVSRQHKDLAKGEETVAKLTQEVEEIRVAAKEAVSQMDDLQSDVRRLKREVEDEASRGARLAKENEELYTVNQQLRAEVQAVKGQLTQEASAMTKYKRMVGEIGKLIDWAQNGGSVTPSGGTTATFIGSGIPAAVPGGGSSFVSPTIEAAMAATNSSPHDLIAALSGTPKSGSAAAALRLARGRASFGVPTGDHQGVGIGGGGGLQHSSSSLSSSMVAGRAPSPVAAAATVVPAGLSEDAKAVAAALLNNVQKNAPLSPVKMGGHSNSSRDISSSSPTKLPPNEAAVTTRRSRRALPAKENKQ